jgi:hypothetical protein
MKSRKEIQCLTLGLISIVCFPEISLAVLSQIKPAKFRPTFNQQSGEIQKLAQNQQPAKTQPTSTPRLKKKLSTLDVILNLFKERKGPKLGSRSGNVCLLSPGLLEERNIIWSDRPLFLWEAVSLPQEIRLYSPSNPKKERQIIWRQNLNQLSPEITFQGIQYTGQALEKGKVYNFKIFNELSKSKNFVRFQVMELKERDRISEELQRLETELKFQRASNEQITIERANYFIEQDLWSDALQEMFSVKKPSLELTQMIGQVLRDLCTN